MNDEFEQRLNHQQMKEIPSGWRAEILAAANSGWRTTSNVARPGFLSTINHQLSALLWPHPKAWAGLAVVWVLILVVNFSLRDASPRVAEKYSPTSPEMMVELRRQNQLFAELVGSTEVPLADRQKLFLPRPRSERVEVLVT